MLTEIDIGDHLFEEVVANSGISYALPFLQVQDGVTLEINVTVGSIFVAVSFDELNPTSENNDLSFNISGFYKVFLHEIDINRTHNNPAVYVALYGIEQTNVFDLVIISTTGTIYYKEFQVMLF